MHDRSAVILGGALADTEFPGDNFIRTAGQNQFQDLVLSRRQRRDTTRHAAASRVANSSRTIPALAGCDIAFAWRRNARTFARASRSCTSCLARSRSSHASACRSGSTKFRIFEGEAAFRANWRVVMSSAFPAVDRRSRRNLPEPKPARIDVGQQCLLSDLPSMWL